MKKHKKLLFVTMIIVAVVATFFVGCKKEKTEVLNNPEKSETQELHNRIKAFQTLCDAVNSGTKADGTMTVEEMRQILDLTSNYEYSQHMTYCVGTVLDTLHVAMPIVDNEGNVSENDVVATYSAFETELQKCLAAVNDGKNLPSYFSILMPENGAKDIDEIEIVFIRGIEGEYPKENAKSRDDDDGPFIEGIDYWHWGDSLGLCKPDPISCTSDAAQQLSEEFVFVIPDEHQGESYTISNVVHAIYRPCNHAVPDYESIYYVDPNMEDCAETWLFCNISDFDDDICLLWYELNCYWRSIIRNIVDPSAPLHYAPGGNPALAPPYHCCIIDPRSFQFETYYFKIHTAHVIYCDICWTGNETPPIH